MTTDTDLSLQLEIPQVLETYLAGQLTEGTRRIYRRDILDFFSGSVPTLQDVRNLSPAKLVFWRNEAWGNGNGRLAASTINRKLVALKSFYDLLLAGGVVPLNPAHPKLVRRIKEKRGSAHLGITKEEMSALLQACHIGPNEKANYRDYALISLLYTCLLRRSEAHGFNWNHLNKDGSRSLLRLPHTKAGTQDFVPLEPEMLQILDRYFHQMGGALQWASLYGKDWIKGPAFFALDNGHRGDRLTAHGINDVVKKRARIAGIREISAHTIRHTGITHMLLDGASLVQVQTLARHADPKQTVEYAQLLRRVMESPGKSLAALLTSTDDSVSRISI